MSVKTIFKTLIGTLVIIVVVTAVVEIFNVSTTGLQLNQLTKIAGKQSAVLFTQENYKRFNSGGGAVNQSAIRDTNGNIYVEGKFYTSEDTVSIYNSIYQNPKFRDWINNEPAVQKGNWYNLKLIDRAINRPESLNVKFGTDGYDSAMMAKLYKDAMLTPSNLGIPYIDQDIMNRMFKWNLTQLLSNCNPESIVRDDSGRGYVAFKGFRIYTDMANITNLDYKTFDLKNAADRANFNRITNINPDKLGFEFDKNLQKTTGQLDDERSRVCLVGISYSVPMTYTGITPMKEVFNFIWNNEVEGLENSPKRTGKGETYNESLANLESGGLEGRTIPGALPIPGRLVYYIIR